MTPAGTPMRILVLGADGYLGWPTSMHFAARGHTVLAVDNYLRRTVAMQTRSQALLASPDLEARAEIYRQLSGREIGVRIGDVSDYRFLSATVQAFKPEAIVHYAEQPSAPYSMKGFDEANLTLRNNLSATLNVIWAVMEHAPDAHIVKLGTMGEYGTPNIDIEEGWIDIEHKGRRDRFLFPRQAGSLYHTTKILDTDLLWFYVRTFKLRVTDLMQGPVYGLSTPEADVDSRLLPNFHYDDIFGTVVNRFLVQAVVGVPLTVYGRGNQIRGYLNLNDTMQCVDLAVGHPAERGELRVFNQFTETLSVNEIAGKVRDAALQLGVTTTVTSIPNPRREAEAHYYNPAHSGLIELGLEPHFMTETVLVDMLETVMRYKHEVDTSRIMPRVRWS